MPIRPTRKRLVAAPSEEWCLAAVDPWCDWYHRRTVAAAAAAAADVTGDRQEAPWFGAPVAAVEGYRTRVAARTDVDSG